MAMDVEGEEEEEEVRKPGVEADGLKSSKVPVKITILVNDRYRNPYDNDLLYYYITLFHDRDPSRSNVVEFKRDLRNPHMFANIVKNIVIRIRLQWGFFKKIHYQIQTISPVEGATLESELVTAIMKMKSLFKARNIMISYVPTMDVGVSSRRVTDDNRRGDNEESVPVVMVRKIAIPPVRTRDWSKRGENFGVQGAMARFTLGGSQT